ncbi:hypothetical protein DFH08DRAFT_814862 [Mycena albidolilacea]|uniref:Uncharacterized protein n=1 Tax=Mycena albidolilacea TaxID=1033008 RepID=A0AAD7EKF8_9AGAR|nr:hypothetical protein DFH08DRAFT_814862 [Mycena albidolilacea]
MPVDGVGEVRNWKEREHTVGLHNRTECGTYLNFRGSERDADAESCMMWRRTGISTATQTAESLSVARRDTVLLVVRNIGSREGVEHAVGDEKGSVRGGCKWGQSRPSSWTQNAVRRRHESAEVNSLHRWSVYAREMERVKERRGRVEKKNLESECEREFRLG